MKHLNLEQSKEIIEMGNEPKCELEAIAKTIKDMQLDIKERHHDAWFFYDYVMDASLSEEEHEEYRKLISHYNELKEQ